MGYLNIHIQVSLNNVSFNILIYDDNEIFYYIMLFKNFKMRGGNIIIMSEIAQGFLSFNPGPEHARFTSLLKKILQYSYLAYNICRSKRQI